MKTIDMNFIQRIALSIISTDKSLAFDIRKIIEPKIQELFPVGYFRSWDTNEEGKGFRPGYVSFAFYPTIWGGKNLVGGILIQCVYSSKIIKSTAPEKTSPEYKIWLESGGNINLNEKPVEDLTIEIGYYSKKGNVLSHQRDAGQALVEVDNQENVSLELVNPEFTKTQIEELAGEIYENPPDAAMGVKAKRQQNDQYTSVGKFINWLHSENRNVYTQNELNALVQGSGKLQNSLRDALGKRGFTLK